MLCRSKINIWHVMIQYEPEILTAFILNTPDINKNKPLFTSGFTHEQKLTIFTY